MMLPPSDSFRHQSRKLAEVLTSLQNGVTSIPPPPYGATDPHDSVHDEMLSNVDAGEEWESNPRPIAIHIDASISALGDSNTIIIPSMASHQAPARTATPTELPTPSPSTPYAQGILQTAQKQRQARLTEMATSIIAALQDSDLLCHSESGGHAPVEIRINTGVKIEGSRNTICAGTPGRLPSRRNAQNEAVGDEQNWGRKRRAQSEPLDLPAAKRGCLPSFQKK